jgi:dihydrofolate reductase
MDDHAGPDGAEEEGAYENDREHDDFERFHVHSRVDAGPKQEIKGPSLRTQYYCAATLDGYIADAGDGIDWLTGYEGSFESATDGGPMTEGGAYERFYADVGALVSGSVTYEFILRHVAGGATWPYAGKPYWVLSSRDLPVPEGDGVDVRIENAPVGELHERMVESAGAKNLWIVGGGNVASQFADAGLLDDVLVTVVPVVLGDGKPLFDRGLPGGPLQLTAVSAHTNGMVALSYRLSR